MTGRPVRYGELSSALVTPDTSTVPGAMFENVSLETSRERSLRCLLRRPAESDARSPAIVLAGGIRTGRRAVRLIGDAFDGVAISCDYGWSDPTRGGAARLLWRLPRARAELLATPEALALAGAYVASRADVDGSRLAGVGASLGVPFVAAWAARDTLVRATALLYGVADIARVLEVNLGGIPWGWARRAVAAAGALLLRPIEPARTTPHIAPRPRLIVSARDDSRVPVEAAEALIRAAGPGAAVVWVGGRHILPTEAELLRALADTTSSWLRGALR